MKYINITVPNGEELIKRRLYLGGATFWVEDQRYTEEEERVERESCKS